VRSLDVIPEGTASSACLKVRNYLFDLQVTRSMLFTKNQYDLDWQLVILVSKTASTERGREVTSLSTM
jgi:hypothetical protein